MNLTIITALFSLGGLVSSVGVTLIFNVQITLPWSNLLPMAVFFPSIVCNNNFIVCEGKLIVFYISPVMSKSNLDVYKGDLIEYT